MEVDVRSRTQLPVRVPRALNQRDIDTGAQIVVDMPHVHWHEVHAASLVALAQVGRQKERLHPRAGGKCREVAAIDARQRELHERHIGKQARVRRAGLTDAFNQRSRLVAAAAHPHPVTWPQQPGDFAGVDFAHVVEARYRRLIVLARNPAPKPLSMFTTATPEAQLFNMPSNAATPLKLAP